MIRAIICDDETAAQKIISYLIEADGLPIEIVGTATNGKNSLDLIRQEKPDLVFLDISMPELNGFEVIENMQETETKVIIVTAFGTFSYAQRALRLGVSDIIAKPIDIEQLRQAIERAIGWSFTSSDTLNRALYYLHNNYHDKVSLERLAHEAYCTDSHISHLFRKHLHMSVTEYVSKMRIKKAAQMLGAGASIQEVSSAVGYSSINNFYKYFKLYMNETPASYQKKIIPPDPQ